MRLVNEQHGVVLLGQCEEVRERGLVAVHAVDGFDGDECPRLRLVPDSRPASSGSLCANNSVRKRLSRNPSIIDFPPPRCPRSPVRRSLQRDTTVDTDSRPQFVPEEFVRGNVTLYIVSRDGVGTAGPLITALNVDVVEAAETYATSQPGVRLAKPLLRDP